jgi:hypothetical protein
MRLLNVHTRQLEEFFGDAIPHYAILSHTWGKEEVTLQDLSKEGHRQKQGYTKIEGCCQQAIKDELSWVWVDTCCIDKTSSAELSEAINSMFRWYENSDVCYAYLQDVPSGTDIYEQDSPFAKSRWFTRGWTLQELLAPRLIQFYDTNWMLISHKNPDHLHRADALNWFTLLENVTSIDRQTFQDRWYIRSVSAAYKFSWMAGRSTTRVEDEAYCLLGLLDINMPLLYGEGDKAFIRLQEAILRNSEDVSLLAWGCNLPYTKNDSILARSPSLFLGFPWQNRRHNRPRSRVHSTLTGRGLHIELLMTLIDARNRVWLGAVEEETWLSPGIGILLRQSLGGTGNLFARAAGCPPVPIHSGNLIKRLTSTAKRKEIYIAPNDDNFWNEARSSGWDVRLLGLPILLRSRAPTGQVNISFIRETGYSFSSSWPSVSYFSRSLGKEPSITCIGPHSNTVYMIFSNDRQDRVAVRLSLRWGKRGPKSMETAFCVISDRYLATAFEHCCGSKVDSKVPQFTKDMDWSLYIAMTNLSTNENGHLCAIYGTRLPRGGLIGCRLVWKKGPYSEKESR